ncbi:phage tail sheath C-terminal domain-containing protein [Lentisphaerota bacterium WC36G]|nr:phage tail sheath subtilisin-like domain-containing protein [Lentisphaerae bacterium WC36]
MAEQFLHGVEVVNIDDGTRPIQTVKSSVIGVVGTAPNADTEAFPLNTPVLIAGNLKQAAKLGATGTLPDAINGIFDQVGAMVVVVRVAEAMTEDAEPAIDTAKTQSNIIGGIDETTGEFTGLQCLIAAESVIAVQPRIIIAPEYSNIEAVVTEMINVATRLKGVAVVDCPQSLKPQDAITYRKLFGDKRCYCVFPHVKVWDTVNSCEAIKPASSRVAGLIAKIDNELGFWHSPSNKTINGIIGTETPIDFKLGDSNCYANLLNENFVTTIIQQDGYRLWGNRTCSNDMKWTFINVVRTADLINDSLQREHLWAVDRNITKTYVEDVTAGVNNYLRHLTTIGAILGGECWADEELNTPSELQAGKVYFDFDFTPPTPAEHITFRSHLVNDYFKNIFK